MLKKEIIWREILNRAIEKKQFEFTQSELAKKFGFSLSTIFNALKIPRSQGAIKVAGKNFSVVDLEKMLYIWATRRKLKTELIYQASAPLSAKEIEGLMPAGITYGAYSAYSQKHGDAPSDYDKVYVYAGGQELGEIKKRFPKAKGRENVFVFKKDLFTEPDNPVTADAQTFVDLWNLPDWYAKEFLKKLKEKIL